MSIVMYLGHDVKEYENQREKLITQYISDGLVRCELCTRILKRHSSYERGIKETGAMLKITMVWCRVCKHGHALLPDFILPHKHYGGNEIESVIIDGSTTEISHIETEASESTARRWIRQIGERLVRAISILKYVYASMRRPIGEIEADVDAGYAELEQVLAMAPVEVVYSGNKLGLANMWLGKHSRGVYI